MWKTRGAGDRRGLKKDEVSCRTGHVGPVVRTVIVHEDCVNEDELCQTCGQVFATVSWRRDAWNTRQHQLLLPLKGHRR